MSRLLFAGASFEFARVSRSCPSAKRPVSTQVVHRPRSRARQNLSGTPGDLAGADGDPGSLASGTPAADRPNAPSNTSLGGIIVTGSLDGRDAGPQPALSGGRQRGGVGADTTAAAPGRANVMPNADTMDTAAAASQHQSDEEGPALGADAQLRGRAKASPASSEAGVGPGLGLGLGPAAGPPTPVYGGTLFPPPPSATADDLSYNQPRTLVTTGAWDTADLTSAQGPPQRPQARWRQGVDIPQQQQPQQRQAPWRGTAPSPSGDHALESNGNGVGASTASVSSQPPLPPGPLLPGLPPTPALTVAPPPASGAGRGLKGAWSRGKESASPGAEGTAAADVARGAQSAGTPGGSVGAGAQRTDTTAAETPSQPIAAPTLPVAKAKRRPRGTWSRTEAAADQPTAAAPAPAPTPAPEAVAAVVAAAPLQVPLPEAHPEQQAPRAPPPPLQPQLLTGFPSGADGAPAGADDLQRREQEVQVQQGCDVQQAGAQQAGAQGPWTAPDADRAMAVAMSTTAPAAALAAAPLAPLEPPPGTPKQRKPRGGRKSASVPPTAGKGAHADVVAPLGHALDSAAAEAAAAESAATAALPSPPPPLPLARTLELRTREAFLHCYDAVVAEQELAAAAKRKRRRRRTTAAATSGKAGGGDADPSVAGAYGGEQQEQLQAAGEGAAAGAAAAAAETGGKATRLLRRYPDFEFEQQQAAAAAAAAAAAGSSEVYESGQAGGSSSNSNSNSWEEYLATLSTADDLGGADGAATAWAAALAGGSSRLQWEGGDDGFEPWLDPTEPLPRELRRAFWLELTSPDHFQHRHFSGSSNTAVGSSSPSPPPPVPHAAADVYDAYGDSAGGQAEVETGEAMEQQQQQQQQQEVVQRAAASMAFAASGTASRLFRTADGGLLRPGCDSLPVIICVRQPQPYGPAEVYELPDLGLGPMDESTWQAWGALPYSNRPPCLMYIPAAGGEAAGSGAGNAAGDNGRGGGERGAAAGGGGGGGPGFELCPEEMLGEGGWRTYEVMVGPGYSHEPSGTLHPLVLRCNGRVCVNARHVWDLLDFIADPSRDAVRAHLTNIALLQRRGSSGSSGAGDGNGSTMADEGGLSDVEDWALADWDASASANATGSSTPGSAIRSSSGGGAANGRSSSSSSSSSRRRRGGAGGGVTGSGELLSPLFCHWLLLRRWGAQGLAHVRWGPGDTLGHVKAVRANPSYELSRVAPPPWGAVARAATEAQLNGLPPPPPPPRQQQQQPQQQQQAAP